MKINNICSRNKAVLFLSICTFFVCIGFRQRAQVNPSNQVHITEPKKTEFLFSDSCSFTLTHEELRSQKQVTLTTKNTCDSFKLYVPAGGTVTSASLYTNENRSELIARTPSFGLLEVYFEEDSIVEIQHINFMTLDSKRKGKFFLDYGSCHWGSQMWVEIK